MKRVGRAIAVLATLAATAGGADAHAAPREAVARTTAATFTVNSAADDDDGACTAVKCTLRDALAASNAAAGPDTNTIAFAIAPDGPATITLLAALPAVTQPVLIDGDTQPGSRRRHAADRGHDHGWVGATARLHRGLGQHRPEPVLHGDATIGVFIGAGAHDADVFDCHIGTARDGTSPSHDLTTGVELNTDHNLVEANVIANSLYGVDIEGGDKNLVYSNTIGLGADEGADYGYARPTTASASAAAPTPRSRSM